MVPNIHVVFCVVTSGTAGQEISAYHSQPLTLPQESSDITTRVAVVLNIPVVFCVVTSSITGNTKLPQPAVNITTG